MKFRTISRLLYLKRARHRRGHGIHSPFLFHLITTVVEDKRRLPEYDSFKRLKKKAMEILAHFSDPSFTKIYHQFNLQPSESRKLYKKIEVPARYGKVVFRLIREFKPSSIINYGPTFGAHTALMAIANDGSCVCQVINEAEYEFISKELLKDSSISNICFFTDNRIPSVDPEFVLINYPFRPDLARSFAEKSLGMKRDNDVLIIRGIHESKEMEAIWLGVMANENVRVSLDLFEIGIVLFRKGLQKENFIHRF